MPSAFKDETARRLLMLLGDTEDTGSPRGPGVGASRGVVLVRCDSATPADAADVGGVGEQCFPGTIVDQEGQSPEQIERSDVWLTILDGAGWATPTADVVYPCVLSGMVEAATDDERRRALSGSAVGGPGGGGGAVACSAAGGWSRHDCLSLTVPSASGACAGIDTTQELTLTWDAGDGRWESGDNAADVPEDDFVHDLGLGPALFGFSSGQPRLTLDGVSGFYVGCSGGGLLFSFGGESLCDGAHVGCADNSFTILISCACCEIAGYTTAGWYRVLPAGLTCEDECAGVCRLLSSECEAAPWVICDGPAEDEAACVAAGECPEDDGGGYYCPSGVLMGCEGGPGDIFYRVGPGHYQSADGSVSVTWSGAAWIVTDTGCDPDMTENAGLHGTDYSLPTCTNCLFFSWGFGAMTCDWATPDFVLCCDPGEAEPPSALARSGNAKAARKPIAPCKFRGRDLTGPERAAAGVGHGRKWSLCLHPDQPKGPAVCPCKGCGPKCEGYTSA